MGREIFLKTFDGPQKKFLMRFFPISFRFILKSYGGLSTEYSDLPSRGFKK